MNPQVQLPKRIFFCGAPGSQFSGIAQVIEEHPEINTSDHAPHRIYRHHNHINDHTNHGGAYFGTGMEFKPDLDADYIDSVWTEPGGTRLVKSHEWPYKLDQIAEQFPDDWIMLVYRPDMSCYSWWFEAGGFSITYPNYEFYKNHTRMLGEIATQNNFMLKFANKHDLTWNHVKAHWFTKTFGHPVQTKKVWRDVLVAVKKGKNNGTT